MFQAQPCGKWIVDVEEFMIKIRDLSHGTTGIGSALKASGMVATRNQKIDQDNYLPPFLHLQNLAPYISTELGGFSLVFTTSPCTWHKRADPNFPKVHVFSSLTTRG